MVAAVCDHDRRASCTRCVGAETATKVVTFVCSVQVDLDATCIAREHSVATLARLCVCTARVRPICVRTHTSAGVVVC